ncbi:MAG: hypothetical protein RLZZ210_887, partial [Pseudomonadota bacterium]
EILQKRGMIISDEDKDYALDKLSQISYYRLNGFWRPCRKSEGTYKSFEYITKYNKTITRNIEKKLNEFEEGTSFKGLIELYEFDTKLRLLMLNAIQFIEVFMRTTIAYQLSFDNSQNKSTPLNYKNENIINTANKDCRKKWSDFKYKIQKQVNDSKEDFIVIPREGKKDIPFWVIIEIWDFGTLSTYYEILKTNHQKRICQELGIESPDILTSWLREINILRNRCAHHARIWNYTNPRALNLKSINEKQLRYTNKQSPNKIYGLICVINFLLNIINPKSNWINEVVDLINTKPILPNCNFDSMGISSENGLDIAIFDNL